MNRALGFVWILGSSALLAAAPAGKERPILLPGGVADPAAKIGFVRGEADGIDAFQLETGRPLWHAKEDLRPLAIVSGRLATRALVPGKSNALRIVALDPGKEGQRALESDPVEFPDWVSVTGGIGKRFVSETFVDGGSLVLEWKAESFYQYWGGAAPSPISDEQRKSFERHAGGTARIDLSTGRVEMRPAPEPPPAGPDSLGAEEAAEIERSGISVNDIRFPKSSFARLLSVEAVPGKRGGMERVSLKRPDPVPLLTGNEIRVEPSLDRGHLLLFQATGHVVDPPRNEDRWIFSLETGRKVGEVHSSRGKDADLRGPICVLGGRIYALYTRPRGRDTGWDPRSLVALDLESGTTIWERPVRGEDWPPPPPP